MGKKILSLAFILVTAFASKGSGTCTLDVAGKCHCRANLVNNEIVSYSCVSGSTDARCVCPPPGLD